MTCTPLLHLRDDLVIPESPIAPASSPVGDQRPSWFCAPPLNHQRIATVGSRFLEACDFLLLPWQQIQLSYMLDMAEDGQWSSPDVVSIVPRQNGKNWTITGLELVHLFLLGTSQIVHTAHQFKTAKAAFRDLRDVIESHDFLLEQVRSIRDSGQETCIVLHSGSRIDFIARSSGAGRGFTVDLLILDEAYALDQDSLESLLPTVDAATNPQVIYASSTGYEDSEILAGLHERILTLCSGDEIADPADARFLGMEWGADLDEYDWRSQEAAQASNPSLGYFVHWHRIKPRQDVLGEEAYKRERLGVWAKTQFDTAIPLDAWQASQFSPAMIAGDRIIAQSLALEVSRDRDRAYLALAALTRSGRVLVDIIRDDPGTAWVYDAIREEYVKRNPASGVVIDSGSAAASMEHTLMQFGLDVRFVTSIELGKASAMFFDRVTATPDPALLHAENRRLDDAAYTAGRRFMGASKSAWTWSENSGVSVQPLRAVTLALWGLTLNPDLTKSNLRRRNRGR